MKTALIIALLAACDSGTRKESPPTPPPPPRHFVDAGTDAKQVATVAPPADAMALDPTAAFFDLPQAMIARDGSRVLLKVIDEDGARGDPNLALELRDRRDKKLERVVVLALEEQLDDKTRDERAAAAARLLASVDFVPLERLLNDNALQDGHHEGSGITIDWQRERFTIKQGGKIVVERSVPPAWRGRSWFNKGEGIQCSNPDFLRTAFVAPEAKLAVVDVAYRGNDTCWEPTATLHVVAW